MAAAFQLTPIAENLRREELVLQIADRLQLIQTLAETLFDRVDSRLTAVSARLEDIDRRSSVCGRKIAQVKTDEGRATTLYSHHKYPAEEIGTAETVDGLLADDRGYSLEEELKRRLAAKPNCSAKKYEQISSTHIPYDDDAKVKSQFFIYDKVPNVSLISISISSSISKTLFLFFLETPHSRPALRRGHSLGVHHQPQLTSALQLLRQRLHHWSPRSAGKRRQLSRCSKRRRTSFTGQQRLT